MKAWRSRLRRWWARLRHPLDSEQPVNELEAQERVRPKGSVRKIEKERRER